MSELARKIVESVRPLFDAVGGVNRFLVLGLETRPNRDLDEFTVSEGKYRFDGFRKHLSPLVLAAIKAIEANGRVAKQLRYSSEVSIKKLAVLAGLGVWGKSSLVIHPKFGPWLRFVVLDTGIRGGVRFDNYGYKPCRVSPVCANCDLCVKACPAGIIQNFFLNKKEACLAYLDLEHPASTRRCELCLSACPLGTPR